MCVTLTSKNAVTPLDQKPPAFGYVLDHPSFLRIHKFSLYKPHIFKQQIKVAALCSLLLEVAAGFCRIKVGSIMNAFKATEFKSESALNCLIQKVNSSILLPCTVRWNIEYISPVVDDFVVNTIDNITEARVVNMFCSLFRKETFHNWEDLV